ncbi:MAG: hypothetical protein JJU11_12880, partial [Candidatus Sumerlaeia bacterium]|nr:hypothetical protein [Candidatus Sumerlaeia bacterium]
MLIFRSTRNRQRFVMLVLLLTFPYLSGMLELADRVHAAMQPSASESVAYEIHGGSWSHVLANSTLQRSPLRIFDWVRTNIEYEPYTGSRKGAEGTYLSRKGNALDQASLLGALFDEASLPWRYATADIRLTIDQAERWLGLASPSRIADYLSESGVRATFLPNLHSAEHVVIRDHVWVQFRSDFLPLMGSAHHHSGLYATTPKDPADSWVDLDPTITFRSSTLPLDLSLLTAMSPAELKNMVEAGSDYEADTASTPATVEGIEVGRIHNVSREAGERIEAHLAALGIRSHELGKLLGELEIADRPSLPGNLPGEVVGSITVADPKKGTQALDFLRNRRDTIRISIGDSEYSHTWDQMGVPRLAGHPVTLSFEIVEKDYLPDHTADFPNTNAVPLLHTEDTTGNGQPDFCALVRPVLRVGPHLVHSQTPPVFPYGRHLSLSLELGGNQQSHKDEITVVAGGIYGLALHNTLDHDSATTLSQSISTESHRHELLRKVTDLTARSVLHHQEALETAALSAHGLTPVRSSVRGVVAGLEPAVKDGYATGVRLATWQFGAPSKAVDRTNQVTLSRHAAAQLSALISDVALTAPLPFLASLNGYQSAGRIMALEHESDKPQVHRVYPSGSILNTAHLPDSNNSPFRERLLKAMRHGTATLSDHNFFGESTHDGELHVGFASIIQHQDGLLPLAYAPEDRRVTGAWSPILPFPTPDAEPFDYWDENGPGYGPMGYTLLFPMDLVIPASGIDYLIPTGGTDGPFQTIRRRASDWADSAVGVGSSLQAAMASSSLLVGEFLEQSAIENWIAAIPVSAAVLHESAKAFSRPRVLDFHVTPTLIRTVDVDHSVDEGGDWHFARESDTLTSAIRFSRAGVDPHMTILTDDCPIQPPHGTELVWTLSNEDFEHCLQSDGTYEVRAYGETIEGLRSETVRRQFEIDNTPPKVNLQDLATTTGIVHVRGSVTDRNLESWQLFYQKAGDGTSEADWTPLSGYGGDYQLHGENSLIASLNTRSLGWTGDYRLLLLATDTVGNVGSDIIETSITNDLLAPELDFDVLGINGSPVTDGSVLWDDETVITFQASDKRDDDTGLRFLRLWIESQDDPTKNRTLVDQHVPAASSDAVLPIQNEYRLDVTTLDRSTANEKFIIHARAEDRAGNVAHQTISDLTVGNIVWHYSVAPSVYNLDSASNNIRLLAQTTMPAKWWYDIYPYNPAAEAFATTPVRSFSSNGQEQQEARIYWNATNSQGVRVEPGSYRVTLTLQYDIGHNNTRTEIAHRDLVISKGLSPEELNNTGPRLVTLITEPGKPDGSTYTFDLGLEIPLAEVSTDFAIAQNSGDQIQIYGRVGSFSAPYMSGGGDPHRMPIDEAGRPQLAFWAVEFKPASVEPFLHKILTHSYGDGWSLLNRDNWIPITWSTNPPADICNSTGCDGNRVVHLATWNADKLPLGYYDVRIWSTDGFNLAHHVLGGIKVVPPPIPGGGEPGSGDIGALTLSSTDMTVPFSGFSAEITRDYNSRDVYREGPLGPGWKLRGISLQVETYQQGIGEHDEAFITLPDGREFWFANNPPSANVGAYTGMKNTWVNYGEYIKRPYGMRLFRPGASPHFHGDDDWSAIRTNEVPPFVIRKAMGDNEPAIHLPKDYWPGYGRGEVAFLQIEDKTWYLFEWRTGDLIEIIHPDGQITTFDKNGTTSSQGISSELVIRDTANRELTLERDPSTGRVTAAVDPNDGRVEYRYEDEYGNLTTVVDRSGFKRFYVYDTPDTLEFFRANFPSEADAFTGIFPHRLVDVRIDDDTDGIPNFEGDVVPSGLDTMTLADRRDALLKTQNWPGDTSIMRFRYSGDDIIAYETSAGSADLEYDRHEDGTGSVDITQRESNRESKVEYNNTNRVEKITDIYGEVTTYDYQDTEHVRGVLKREIDALRNVTKYDYQNIPQVEHNSFSDMFADLLERKMTCGGTFYTDSDYCEDFIPSNSPGYLTGAQLQPATITQAGKDGAAPNPIITKILYDMDGDSRSAFQPRMVTDPLDNETRLAYNGDIGRLEQISRRLNGGTEEILSSTEYITAGTFDPIYN